MENIPEITTVKKVMRIKHLPFAWASCLAALFAVIQSGVAQEDVRLTEFMASNTRTLQDEDHDYPDWIEIFNNTSNTVSLANWSLTDSASDLGKWHFPPTNMLSHQFIVVFASGKNRRVPGLPL